MTHHSATYCPEDNKLRLYPDWDDPDFDKEVVKAAGFKWASKQECYVCPRWTPTAEDALLDLVDEIDDEDYSPEERSADRAERFSGYRDKRRGEAVGHADTFDAGPSAFGHQNRQRAERQAARHDRHRTRAVSQWSKAEYWQTRTAGVIDHALYKSSAKVRRSRLVRLEAEQRKHQAAIDNLIERYKAWLEIRNMGGNNTPWSGVKAERGWGIDPKNESLAFVKAYMLLNNIHSWLEVPHPRTGEVSTLSDHLMDEQDPITPKEAADLWLENVRNPEDPDSRDQRWCKHYELRIGYEKAMLEAEGGMAGELEMKVGGFIGRFQIHQVNKSPATSRITSVRLMGDDGKLQLIKLERFGENIGYRDPTDEELAAFEASKKKAKSNRPKQPKLINPTIEDAQKLQDLWNKEAKKLHEKHNCYGEYTPTELIKTTQSEYSKASRGSYSSFEAVSVCENGLRPKRWEGNQRAENPPVAFKIRKRYGRGSFTAQADAIVILMDKPQKPLPLDWDALEEKPVEAGKLF